MLASCGSMHCPQVPLASRLMAWVLLDSDDEQNVRTMTFAPVLRVWFVIWLAAFQSEPNVSRFLWSRRGLNLAPNWFITHPQPQDSSSTQSPLALAVSRALSESLPPFAPTSATPRRQAFDVSMYVQNPASHGQASGSAPDEQLQGPSNF